MDDLTNTVLTGMAALFVVIGVWGTHKLWSAYRHDTDAQKSWLLLMLVVVTLTIEVVTTYLITLNAIRRFYGPLALPEWTPFVSLVAFLVLLGIPAYIALTVEHHTGGGDDSDQR